MSRNHQLSFQIFFYICFLSISLTSSPKVTVTIGQPYETETTSKFRLYGVEDFDMATVGWHPTYVSYFNSSGHQSLTRGPYNDCDTNGYIQGRYTSLHVDETDILYGVGPTGGRYALPWRTSELVLTNTSPFGINYFGFHGEYLKYRIRVEFYFGTDMIFELKLIDIITFLTDVGASSIKPKYLYNPNPEFERRTVYPPYAFVNVYFDGVTFDTVKFRTATDEYFGMDMHTFGSYISQDGLPISVTTNYIEPKNKLPEQPKYPVPEIPKAFARVVYEEPNETNSTVIFHWRVDENFNGVPEGHHSAKYMSHFHPKNIVQGTYSGPFDIIKKDSKERYFSTTDSLLNLTVTLTGIKKPNFFGLYLNPPNRHGSLEFFLNGESIFVFYLADAFDFVQNKPEYKPGDKASTKRFIFINIIFTHITYDAVRFRNWAHVGGAVTSDNHFIGEWTHHTGKWLEPLRTILKVKESLSHIFVK